MLRPWIIAAAIAALPAAAVAHHGWSSYDESKPITLTGYFETVSWTNPHGTATMRWQGKPWTVVLAPIGRMEARGLTEDEISQQQRVTITGYVRRDGTPEMRIERITVDGDTIELR